jgi:hypothetical protein
VSRKAERLRRIDATKRNTIGQLCPLRSLSQWIRGEGESAYTQTERSVSVTQHYHRRYNKICRKVIGDFMLM